MRAYRPYIPYSVRALVAERQADAKGFRPDPKLPANLRLRSCLIFLFGTAKVHLDHDPALENRTKIMRRDGQIGGYIPPANDPNFLIYRIAEDHRIKTYVRGDGALRSDVSQHRYLKRVASNRKPKAAFKPRRTKHIRRFPNDATVIRGHDQKAK